LLAAPKKSLARRGGAAWSTHSAVGWEFPGLLLSRALVFASAGFAWRAQLAVTDRTAQRDQETREQERRSQAKVILGQFPGPLLDAAWQLGDRIDHIRNRRFCLSR
jgi:hypothetical protein